MKRMILFMVVLMLGLVLAATVIVLDVAGAEPALSVVDSDLPASAVANGTGSIEATARVVPATRIELSFPTRGIVPETTVAEVLVQEGASVTQGTVLARLDTRDVELRIEEARALLAQATAAYDQLRAEAEAARLRAEAEATSVLAEREAARLRAESDIARLRADASAAQAAGRSQAGALLHASADVLAQAMMTQQQGIAAGEEKLAAARSGMETAAAAGIAAAAARVQQAEAALRRAELALELSTLRAPIDGTVVEMNLKVGQVPGVDGPAVIIADLTRWQIETEDVTDRDVAMLREGDRAVITFAGLPDVELPGRVTHIAAIGQETPDQLHAIYRVVITPDRHEERLRWNMAASVAITPTSGTARTGVQTTSEPVPNTVGTPVVTPGGLPNGDTYTVQPGDTLSSIAAQYGVTVDHIRAINALDDADYLTPGLVLRIPVEP